MADWLGGIVGGLGGLGNALMALRQMQNQESLTKMRLMEGQGTWMPTPTQGNFLQNLLSIAPEGMARVGNQSYQLQPFPTLGEEGARALGFAQPVTMPEGFVGPPPPPEVSPWAANMRMDPKTIQALMQQQFLAKRQADREEAAMRLMEARQDAIASRTQGQQERMFELMKDFYGGGVPGPSATAAPGMPGVGLTPGGLPPRPVAPAPGPFVPQGAPQGYRLPENWVPPTGFDALPLPQRHAFMKRATQIDALMQERNRLAEKPALNMGGVSISAERKISGLDKQIALLEKQQNEALSQVQDVAKVGAETDIRLGIEEQRRRGAMQAATTLLAAGDITGARERLVGAKIPESEWPPEFQELKEQRKTTARQKVEDIKQHRLMAPAMTALNKLDQLVEVVFTDPAPAANPAAIAKSLGSRTVKSFITAGARLAQTQGLGVKVTTYEDAATAHILTVAKALTGTGRLAFAEVQQMLEGLPKVTGSARQGFLMDTRDAAREKMRVMKDLIQAAKELPPDSSGEGRFSVRINPQTKQLEKVPLPGAAPGVTSSAPVAETPASTVTTPAETNDPYESIFHR